MTKKESDKLFMRTHFYNETFRMVYHFTANKEEYDEMAIWIGGESSKNIQGRCILAENNGKIRIIIGVFNDDLATLAHECIHAALFTLEAVGQKLGYEDELLPYLSEYIFRECQNKMKK